jgi:hypothetical protein
MHVRRKVRCTNLVRRGGDTKSVFLRRYRPWKFPDRLPCATSSSQKLTNEATNQYRKAEAWHAQISVSDLTGRNQATCERHLQIRWEDLRSGDGLDVGEFFLLAAI